MPSERDRLITVSTITTDYKMHFPRDVADELGVKPGSKVVWYRGNNGDIIVRKA